MEAIIDSIQSVENKKTSDFERVSQLIRTFTRGLSDVTSEDVIARTKAGLNPNSKLEEMVDQAISNAVMKMADEPLYSKLASRLLSNKIHREVGEAQTFKGYVETAWNHGILHRKVLDFATTESETIEAALDHSRDDFFEYFGLKTVADRYLLRHPHTRKIIERPQWLFMRVALGLSHNVNEAIRLYEIVSQFFYMPATPTLFNSGTKHPQMSSCYLLTVADDSLEGIYKSFTDCAKLSKFSGGIGIDWTKVRASGALIRGTNGLSNGIVPFLKVFDSSVHAVNQGGKRKGAAAVYLEPWHADIEAFLDLRNNTGAEERRTHNLNLALWITDLFMKRVETDGEWSLFTPDEVPELTETFGDEFEAAYTRYEREGKARKKVPARTLYARMMQALAETGNGWICFKDKANLRSAQTGHPGNVIHSSNLCTEILEVTSSGETAVCNLGSINLSSFVKADRTFDFELLKKVVEISVPFLDRVVDINFYPTTEAGSSNSKWRPVGLGIMGLQDAFFKMKISYQSAEAKRMSSLISETIYFHALRSSMELAKKEGSFPGFAESRYAAGDLQVQLARKYQAVHPELHFDWEALAKEVQANGLRNSLLIAIAPTATIASIVGSYESIEPQISNIFKRETLSGEFLQVNRYLIRDLKERGLWNEEIQSEIITNDGSIQNVDVIPQDLKDLYRTVWETAQKDLIDMAVMRSTFICQSQSLNLFMENPSIGKLSSMYMYAWKQGVKTTYYLRSRAKTAIQKTTVSNDRKEEKTEISAVDAVVCSLENPAACEACQ